MVGVGWHLDETYCLIKKWSLRVNDGDRRRVSATCEVFSLVANSREVRAQGPWAAGSPVVPWIPAWCHSQSGPLIHRS